MNLRWRLARWLVGPFVEVPEKRGVWIVMRWEGGFTAMYEADRFRLKMCSDLPPLNEHDTLPTRSTRGRFAGTVKVR